MIDRIVSALARKKVQRAEARFTQKTERCAQPYFCADWDEGKACPCFPEPTPWAR